MEKKRIRDIERAKKLIITNNSKKIEIKGQNDVRKYIQSNHTTKLGEKAENTSYALNDEEIQKQAKYEWKTSRYNITIKRYKYSN